MSTMTTQFAPAERAPAGILKQQRSLFEANSLHWMILNAIPGVLVVLNQQRQIVFANQAIKILFGYPPDQDLIGLRPGEALGCVHAAETDGGCGTTEFCSTCGAARAILGSLSGQQKVEECRITRHAGGEALDLRVWASPITVEGQVFSQFALMDISDEKRRRALERIFFHDVLNTASGLRGFVELMKSSRNKQDLAEFTQEIDLLTDMLIDEIQAQRELMAAENDDLKLNLGLVDSLTLIEEICKAYHSYQLFNEAVLEIDAECDKVVLTTDKTLLRRVIGNMVKNALEASSPGDTVRIGCQQRQGAVEFWVQNPAVMTRNVQLQVFQRSFSTKGSNRGLGTYSIKLLGERYLRGKASFTSTSEQGTIFRFVAPLYPD